jgi:hypothetical protein
MFITATKRVHNSNKITTSDRLKCDFVIDIDQEEQDDNFKA